MDHIPYSDIFRLFPFPPIQYQNVVLEDVFSFVTSSQSHQYAPVDRVRDPIQSSKGVYMLTIQSTDHVDGDHTGCFFLHWYP